MHSPASVNVSGLRKSFGSLVVIDDLWLEIPGGEICCLLGPSGCGKTTLLRLLAGLEKPDRGAIAIGGRNVSSLAPHQRGLGMVFQNYALFPHMTVAQNIAFGLKMRKMGSAEVNTQVAEAMAMVKLQHMGERMPSQLSGGQRQRVALARSLVTRPSVLLLDEPLSALDKNLRAQMQVEISELQRNVGVTTVIVTHDQDEALGLADSIVVMDRGRILQVGRPQDVYEEPNSVFVADFIGASNTFTGKVVSRRAGAATVSSELGTLDVTVKADFALSTKCLLSIRPENIDLYAGDARKDGRVSGKIAHVVYKGNLTEYLVELENGARIRAAQPNRYCVGGSARIGIRETVSLGWQDKSVILHPSSDDAGAQFQ